MLVAVGTWELHLPGCQSLKDKRGVLKPLTTRLGKTLNVSVAETAHQDRWQRAEVACASVAGDRRVAQETIRAADRVIESADGVRIIDSVTVFL